LKVLLLIKVVLPLCYVKMKRADDLLLEEVGSNFLSSPSLSAVSLPGEPDQKESKKPNQRRIEGGFRVDRTSCSLAPVTVKGMRIRQPFVPIAGRRERSGCPSTPVAVRWGRGWPWIGRRSWIG
jgi:hypothetical protein